MRTKPAAYQPLFPRFLIDHLFTCKGKYPDLLITLLIQALLQIPGELPEQNKFVDSDPWC